MTEFETSAGGYNIYPRTMVRFSVIAYDSMSDIHGAVQALGWDVVWGPAELRSIVDISYCLMYACRNRQTGEYAVVIRGTNFDSLRSWIFQDFDIRETVPFSKLAPQAPANALIAKGTYNGMCDLLKLTDQQTGQTLVSYLQQAAPSRIYVTGHSLGGTLTPTMFACLNEAIYGGGPALRMGLWSFAGLTPGNAGFNSYFNGLFQGNYQWRIFNTLDVAPFCWWSVQGLEAIYQPYGLKLDFVEKDLIQDLFGMGAKVGYAQPTTGQPLSGVFDKCIIDRYMWLAQADHQHSSLTYRDLVDAAFPVT